MYGFSISSCTCMVALEVTKTHLSAVICVMYPDNQLYLLSLIVVYNQFVQYFIFNLSV